MRKGLLGLEAIGFQDGAFFKELTEIIEKMLQENKGIRRHVELIETAGAKAVLACIKKHTNITLTYGGSGGPAIISAPLRNDHIFYDKFLSEHPEIIDLVVKNSKKIKKSSFASVDLANSKVDGYFAEVESTLFMPEEFFSTEFRSVYSKLTAREWAAIVSHELGHAFTFFEFAIRYASTNEVLAYLSLKNSEGAQAYKVAVKVAANVFKLNEKELQVLEEAKSQEDVAVLLLSIQDRKTRAELGCSWYDQTSCEQLADQFATRHGAGLDLITGLDKIGGLRNQGKFSLYFSIVKFVLGLAGAILLPGGLLTLFFIVLTALNTWAHATVADHYDNAEFRPKRVMQDLVEKIKNSELPKEEVKALLVQIDQLEVIVGQKTDVPQLYHYLALLTSSSYRKSYSLEILQKQLESIASNPLFVSAAKLKTLAQ